MNLKFTATAIILLGIVPSTAQEQPANKTPSEYTLTVTPQELGTIGQALGELPFKAAAPLVKKLDEQIARQAQETAKPAEQPPKASE